MTRQQAKELWDRWQWVIAVLLLPFVLWAAKRYDASKVDAHEFELYANAVQAEKVQKEIRQAARDEVTDRKLSYLICRIDGGTLRQCGHLR